MGRIAVVTGASSGIGVEIARLLAARGDLCILLARRAARLEALAEELGGEAEPCDVSDRAAVESVAARVLERHPRIDVLVNNAGISGVGDLSETTPGQWDQVMRVNVRSVFLMSRAVVPGMQERRSGAVVNVASAIADTGLARRVAYAASKGAVLALTRSMQVDCAPHGVRVNAVLPGTIHTPFVDRYLEASYADPEEGLRSISARQLTGELGKPEDVANAILYLASDESRFVLGSGLSVDGGLSGTRA